MFNVRNHRLPQLDLPLKRSDFARCFCHSFIDEHHVGGTQSLKLGAKYQGTLELQIRFVLYTSSGNAKSLVCHGLRLDSGSSL